MQPPVGIDAARNLPTDNKISFSMGQDSATLAEFESSVLDSEEQSDFPVPDGVTLYLGFISTEFHPNSAPEDATVYFTGIEGLPYDNSAGEVDFQATLAAYDARNAASP